MDRGIMLTKAGKLLDSVSDLDFTDDDIRRDVSDIVAELLRCSKCNRPLVVLQHLDYYPGDVCGHCQR